MSAFARFPETVSGCSGGNLSRSDLVRNRTKDYPVESNLQVHLTLVSIDSIGLPSESATS